MNHASVGAGLQRQTMQLGEAEIELFQGGTGPALLFLHGGAGLQQDAPFLEALARRFTVVAPVHPGFGASSLPFWLDAIDDFAHLYLELIAPAGLDRDYAARPFDRRLDRCGDRHQKHLGDRLGLCWWRQSASRSGRSTSSISLTSMRCQTIKLSGFSMPSPTNGGATGPR